MPVPSYHKLLQRQLRRLFDGEPPSACAAFINAVNEAYYQHEDDRALLERSLELTSEELVTRNSRLREELEARERAQQHLHHELQEHQHTEEALRRSMVRLDEAQRIAQIGYWEWHLTSGVAVWSPETYRIFGYDPGTVEPSHALFLQLCHPSDVESLTEALLSARPGKPREVAFRITRPDGEERTLHASGELVVSDEGKPQHAFGVCLDITEQRRYEEALVAALDQAEAAQQRTEEMLRLKTTLLNNISHELRTPLTTIIGSAEILQSEVDPTQREFADYIVQSGRRLHETFSSILTLAQLESGTAIVALQPVDITHEIRETVVLMRPSAEAKGLTLHIHANTPEVWAQIDRTALNRILTNLLSNAVKFTSAGEIVVEVSESAPEDLHDRSEVLMRVRDTGIGIHPDFLPHLFAEFRQASIGNVREHEGVGLGMAITKRLTDLMKGRIEVESEVLKGTTVTIFLPGVLVHERPRGNTLSSSEDASSYLSSSASMLRTRDPLNMKETTDD